MIVNGKEMALPGGITVAELFNQLELEQDRVVVEINREIIPREAYLGTKINSGDQVEIVSFVGGG